MSEKVVKLAPQASNQEMVDNLRQLLEAAECGEVVEFSAVVSFRGSIWRVVNSKSQDLFAQVGALRVLEHDLIRRMRP